MFEVYNELNEKMAFVNQTLAFDVIRENLRKASDSELKFKEYVQQMLEEDVYAKEVNDSAKENFKALVAGDLDYFSNNNYNEDNLKVLFLAINDFFGILTNTYFRLKKELLNKQVEMCNKA